MNKLASSVLVVVGVVLLALGVVEADSIGSSFSRLFTGEPTDRSIWLLLGGGILCVVGLAGQARGLR